MPRIYPHPNETPKRNRKARFAGLLVGLTALTRLEHP